MTRFEHPLYRLKHGFKELQGVAHSRQHLNIPGNNLYGGITEFIGGVQAGYNVEASHLLFGVEGDFDWAAFDHPSLPAPTLGSVSQHWVSTVAGRFGLVTSKSMPSGARKRKRPDNRGAPKLHPVRSSGGELDRLDLQDFAGARDRDRPGLHCLWDLAPPRHASCQVTLRDWIPKRALPGERALTFSSSLFGMSTAYGSSRSKKVYNNEVTNYLPSSIGNDLLD